MRVLVIAATAVFVTNFCYFFCCDVVTCFMYVWPRPLPRWFLWDKSLRFRHAPSRDQYTGNILSVFNFTPF